MHRLRAGRGGRIRGRRSRQRRGRGAGWGGMGSDGRGHRAGNFPPLRARGLEVSEAPFQGGLGRLSQVGTRHRSAREWRHKRSRRRQSGWGKERRATKQSAIRAMQGSGAALNDPMIEAASRCHSRHYQKARASSVCKRGEGRKALHSHRLTVFGHGWSKHDHD